MDQILQHHRLLLLRPSSTTKNSIVCAFKCAGLYIENQHHRHQSKFFDHSQVLIDPPPISLPSSRQYSRLHLYTRDKYEARCIPGPRASSVQCNRRIWIWARSTRLRLLFRYRTSKLTCGGWPRIPKVLPFPFLLLPRVTPFPSTATRDQRQTDRGKSKACIVSGLRSNSDSLTLRLPTSK